jgi:hypothetical protein
MPVQAAVVVDLVVQAVQEVLEALPEPRAILGLAGHPDPVEQGAPLSILGWAARAGALGA